MNAHPTPTLPEFKRFSRDIAPAARAVLMARVYADMERERVNTYIRPIYEDFKARGYFTLDPRWAEKGFALRGPEDLYLCDLDSQYMKDYHEECDEAHRAHGFKGPHGHCPALVADHLRIRTEQEFIDLAEPLFGIKAETLYGENRAKYLELLIGAALKAEKENP